MPAPANEDEKAFDLRTLGALVAEGETLLEARRNPAKGRSLFADFGDAYHGWNAAGKDLVGRLSGPSAARKWDSGWCRAMNSLDMDPAYSIREHDRQQAMLLELRARFGAETSLPRAATPPGAPAEQSPRATVPSTTIPKAARAIKSDLYVMKRDGRDLTNEQLLDDLRRGGKRPSRSPSIGATAVTRRGCSWGDSGPGTALCRRRDWKL